MAGKMKPVQGQGLMESFSQRRSYSGEVDRSTTRSYLGGFPNLLGRSFLLDPGRKPEGPRVGKGQVLNNLSEIDSFHPRTE